MISCKYKIDLLECFAGENVDLGFRILARVRICVGHDTIVDEMVESLLYHTIDSVIRHSRDHRDIGDYFSPG